MRAGRALERSGLCHYMAAGRNHDCREGRRLSVAGELNMRVFLTGASGFIGAHVLRQLLARGHTVTALAMPADPMERLRSMAGRFGVVRGLLQDTDSWRPALQAFSPEGCIHLAW